MIKTLAICCIWGIALPSYVGIIIISQDKDRYKPTNIMECHKGFDRCLSWSCWSPHAPSVNGEFLRQWWCCLEILVLVIQPPWSCWMVHVLVTLLKVALVETRWGLDRRVVGWFHCGGTLWFDGGPTGNSIGSIDVKIWFSLTSLHLCITHMYFQFGYVVYPEGRFLNWTQKHRMSY